MNSNEDEVRARARVRVRAARPNHNTTEPSSTNHVPQDAVAPNKRDNPETQSSSTSRNGVRASQQQREESPGKRRRVELTNNNNNNQTERAAISQRLEASETADHSSSTPTSHNHHDGIPIQTGRASTETQTSHRSTTTRHTEATAPFAVPHQAVPVELPTETTNVSDYPPEILEQVERARRQFGLPPTASFQVNRVGTAYQVVLRTGEGTQLRGIWPGSWGGNGPARSNRIVVPIPSHEATRTEHVIRDIPLDETHQQHMIPAHAGLRLVPGENGQLLVRILGRNHAAAGGTFFQNSSENPRLISIRVDRNHGREGRVAIHLETEDVMRQRARIPPLEPVILPDSQQVLSKRQDAPDTDRFNCGICYEFMEAPSSCGQCSGRFCKACLIKVEQSQRGLCPTCRKPIDHIEEDTDLSKEMDEVDNIPCRFEGCDASLSLRQVKHHEQEVCRMVSVVCRYKEFGCAWKGRRCDLQNHEEADCSLAKVSGLVDRLRTISAERESTAREVTMRMSSLGLAVNHEREMARRQTARLSSNPIDVVSFVIQVTCCSPSLIQAKAAWSDLYTTTMARAAVFNFLTLIPTYLLVARLVWVEYTKCISILRHPQFSLDSVDDETTAILIDSVAGIVVLSLVAGLLVLSLLFDNKSSEGWECFEFPFLSGQVPVMLCATTVGCFLMYSLIFSMFDGFYLPAFLAVVLFSATTVLPTAIASFSCKLSPRINSPPLGVSTGRIAIPLLFGLRYAFVVHVTDVTSCFDALCLLHCLDGPFKLLTRSLGHKELFSDWPPILDVFFVSLGIGRGVRELLSDNSDVSATANWGAAFVLILLVNMIVSRLPVLFEWVGLYLHQVAQASRSNNRSADRKASAIGLGLLSVTVCSYILLATF